MDKFANFINGLFDLLKYYATVGGVFGIVIGAFVLFGLIFLLSRNKNPSTKTDEIIKLFLILFFILSALTTLMFGIYGVKNSNSLKASRLLDKQWAVQLETDDSLKEAQQNIKRFQPDFSDLIVLQKRENNGTQPKFYLFNIYADEMDADVGTNLAHKEWQRFGYDEEFKDSASTKNLTDLCKEFEFVSESNFYKCKNE